MKAVKRKLLILTGLFTVLMSIPFLVPHCGWTALVGFVPLLMMDAIARREGVRRFWWWYYGAFVLWNAVTTFWVGGATVGGAIFAILANALQMALIFAIYRGSRRSLGGAVSLVFLAAMWIAWEKFYFGAEISWPWLTLGNAFARTTHMVQWYEYTGTLGGSLWIWLCNLALYGIICAVRDGSATRMKRWGPMISLCAFTALVVGPMIWSSVIYRNYEEERSQSMDVTIVQPNFDPYHKFEKLTRAEQTSIYLGLASEALKDYAPASGPSLLMAPETFANDVVINAIDQSPTRNSFKDFVSRYQNLNILYGASARRYYLDQKPFPTARHVREGIWAQSYNSALVTDATGHDQYYHKNKLVVGTEYTPYPKIFTKIDDMLGGVMGRCIGDGEAETLDIRSYDAEGGVSVSIPIGCAICYESIYGDFCRQYVLKGARAMTIITNDAWWGNTPGYRQHLSYAALRAIELRRDIARCANTGVSAFIDQRGDIVSKTDWWEAESLQGKVYLNDAQTFFVRNGDIPGRICTFAFLLLLLLAVVRRFIK